MEDWIDITTASWKGVLSPEELAVISSDDITSVLTHLASEIRTAIATWSQNTVSANPLKIPAGFVRRALILARDSLLTGIPGFPQDVERKKQTEAAEQWLRDVATGKIRPQPATDAIANQVPTERPAGVEVVSSRPSRTGFKNMNGL